MIGKNLAAAEGPHQRLAESPLVGALHVAVGGDDGAEVLAELHVRRRAVIDGSNADIEELPGDIARFLRDGFDERVVERHPIDGVAIYAGDAIEAFGLAPEDGRERLEHGRDEDRSERMRFELRIVDLRSVLAAREDVRIEGRKALDVDARSQRVGAARPRSRVAEFARDVRQQRTVRDGAAGLANRLLDDVRIGEVQEERDEIREALVERWNVDVGRIEERRAQAVEQRVRRFVRDDVVAERRADEAALQREARGFLVGAEVAERQVAASRLYPALVPTKPNGLTINRSGPSAGALVAQAISRPSARRKTA